MFVASSLPLERIGELCRRYGVTELSIFGSAVRDQERPDSDMDFLYVLEDPSIGARIIDLQDEFASVVGHSVDLVPKNYLHWVVRDRVLAEAKVIYATG